MTLGTVVDSNVLSYPVLVFMKEQGADVGRGGACPRTLGEAELALGRRARRSLPLDVGQGRVCPGRRARRSQSSVVRARNVAAFLSV